ncbi:hypothetical protein GCM10010172_58540 [Paractinoplanes ferrugineus]
MRVGARPPAAGARSDPRADPVKAGPVKAGPVKAGPVKAGPVKAGPVKAGPVKAGPRPPPDDRPDGTGRTG